MAPAMAIQAVTFIMSIHWQTKHRLLGLRPGCPVDTGPQEGYYFAWVACEKGEVETRKTSQGA